MNCATSYDEVAAGFDGRFRRNVRRLSRRAREMGKIQFHSYRPVEDINRHFQELLDVEAAGWKGESGTNTAIARSGEWATSFLGTGEGTKVTCFQQSYFPMSLGSIYEAATEFCGFKPNYDEDKTMGLAPFGDPRPFQKIVSEIVKVEEDGSIRIDLSYFNYQFWGYRRCSQKFYDTFGQPRKGKDFADHHHNVAAAFQHVLEERALELCAVLRKKTAHRHLIISGGVALNSVMNGRIVRESGFEDIYVMPAAGDNGTSIGAAYYVYHVVHGHPRAEVHNDPYLGTSYSDE